MSLFCTEWLSTEPQTVSDSAQRFKVLSGWLEPSILQCEGAHRQSQEFCAQVWFRKLYCQEMLFATTWRFVVGGLVDNIQNILYEHYIFFTMWFCDIELSNLLVMRAPIQPPSKKTQVQVPYIKDREIVKVRNPNCHHHKTIFSTPWLSLLFCVLTGTAFGLWDKDKHIYRVSASSRDRRWWWGG